MPPGDDESKKVSSLLDSITKTGNKTIDALISVVKKINSESLNLFVGLDEKASEVVGVLGQSRNYAEGIRQSLADAVPELTQIAKGSEAMQNALQAAADAQKEITKSLQTNLLLTGKQMVDISTAAQAYSISNQELGVFIERFVTAGESVNNFPKALEKSANYARSMGVNVDATMEYITKNLDQINKFGFKDGVEGLGRMSARMAAMRIDMNAVYNFADKVFDPENAISMVAGLQRMGVAAGDLADPFRLMYLASEDVEELQKQIGKAVEKFSTFDEKSKTFKMTPNAKRDLRDLEQQMGISYDDLVKMSQQSERLRIVGREIKMGGVDEETKQFLANVAQYDEKKGGFAVKLNMQGDTKLVSEINEKDIESIREANRELSPKEIAKASLDTIQTINNNVAAIKASIIVPFAGSRTASSVSEALRGLSSSVAQNRLDSKTPAQRRQEADDKLAPALNTTGDFIKGTASLTELMISFKNVLPNVTEVFKEIVKSVKEAPNSPTFKQEIMPDNNLINLGNSIRDSFGSAIDRLGEVLGPISSAEMASNVTVNNRVSFDRPLEVNVSGDINLTGQNEGQFAVNNKTSPKLTEALKNTIVEQMKDIA